MPILSRRFLTGFRQTETNEPGLELNEDGTVDLVNPDGSRTALPGGSSSSVTAHLSAAQVAALPVELVAAQGSNKVVVPTHVRMLLGPMTTPYDNGQLSLTAGDNAGTQWGNFNSFLLTDTGADLALLDLPSADFPFGPVAGVTTPLRLSADLPLMLSNAGGGNPADGDGPLVVTVDYVVIDLPT